MQDFKNLSQKKPATGSGYFGDGSKNRRVVPSEGPVRSTLTLPTGKRLRQLKLALLFIAIVLALVPLCVMALRQTTASVSQVRTSLAALSTPAPKQAEAAKPPVTVSRFEVARDLLATAEVNGPFMAMCSVVSMIFWLKTRCRTEFLSP
jgi:penicillin-binding protein A